MKLETWLRLAGIPYELAPHDFSVAPKGKIPYVTEDDGAPLGDSTFIIEHLVKTRGHDPDAGLSREQRAIGLAFRRMLKENLYWVLIQMRFRDAHNWSLYRPVLGGMQVGKPVEVQLAIADAIHKGICEQIAGQGMARHSAEEIDRIGIGDLSAVSDVLGDKPFFFGEQPTSTDATIYGYVANIIEVPLVSAVLDHGRALPNLVSYCDRMRARYFPDLPRA
ncbi:glutathione S-transferase [Chondromyces crocatus]|uniref:Glutathione S-transferase n=2 Tax=Chondromyces crocatus TaxID=52 RepID=A0A0K1EMS9_CHOCO|nr:glutathione S-transferase family protein [Chondromyces crocatus]AKT42149.1 glutathione S-transferase [Chondromyces crocatus]